MTIKELITSFKGKDKKTIIKILLNEKRKIENMYNEVMPK